MTNSEAARHVGRILASYEELTGANSIPSRALRTAIKAMEGPGSVPDTYRYKHLVKDMEMTALLDGEGPIDGKTALKLCCLKLKEAAREFNQLLKYLERGRG